MLERGLGLNCSNKSFDMRECELRLNPSAEPSFRWERDLDFKRSNEKI